MSRGRDPNIARKKIMGSGFRLYTQESIDNISFQKIADDAGVALPTVFRHFPRKQDLVIAIATDCWELFWASFARERSALQSEGPTALKMLEFSLDRIIRFYRDDPAFLKFHIAFQGFVRNDPLCDEQLQDYLDAVRPLREYFRQIYKKAQQDHSIRTDISEQQLYDMAACAMLSTAGCFACSNSWPGTAADDCLSALELLKASILSYCKTE